MGVISTLTMPLNLLFNHHNVLTYSTRHGLCLTRLMGVKALSIFTYYVLSYSDTSCV